MTRDEIASALKAIIVKGEVISNPTSLKTYETDAYTARTAMPLVVALPATVEEVAATLRFCHDNQIKVVPRGAGTSLSGGAIPIEEGVVLAMGKFNRILDIDWDNRAVVVQPGVTNLAISKAVEDRGFYYAPDPSSQIVCTIGGNVAENSGGVHCLKYGMTSNNLLGVELVTIDGQIIRLGGRGLDMAGYDLLGVLTGSEGLLAVITEVTVRILPAPQCAKALLLGFDSASAGANFVAQIIADGIIPAGLEMMDKLAIHAVEDFVHANYPLDAETLLICELDGTPQETDNLCTYIADLAHKAGATSVRISKDEAERLTFWAGRKAAFPAVAKLSPDYLCMDGTIPKGQLAYVLTRMAELSDQYGLRVANVFHAGDGNLHPLIMYDANQEGQMEKAEALGADILKLCVEVGGVLTGEHGVGLEKRDLMGEMFSPTDLAVQQRVKCAFDPDGLMNPGKVFPTLHRCAELGKMHVHKGQLAFPDIPRF